MPKCISKKFREANQTAAAAVPLSSSEDSPRDGTVISKIMGEWEEKVARLAERGAWKHSPLLRTDPSLRRLDKLDIRKQSSNRSMET